jgi:arylsulfatase A-like enzyme
MKATHLGVLFAACLAIGYIAAAKAIGNGVEAAPAAHADTRTGTSSLPNVIFILADDLGWGELGCYGQRQRELAGLPAIRTPRLDELAGRGMRFTQFYAGSPVCAPCRSTLQEGKHTGHCFVRNNHEISDGPDGNYQLPLAAGTYTVGRLMQDAGAATACIGKWGLGGMASSGPTSGYPTSQGYDYYFGYLSQVQAHWYYPEHLWRNTSQVHYAENNGIQGCANGGKVHAQDELTREALQVINTHSNSPFFLCLTYTVPHVSLQEPPHSDPAQAALGKTAVDEFYGDVGWNDPPFACPGHYTGNPRPRRAYAAMITAMDRDIGRIMDRLTVLNLATNTVVIFTSDNGTTYCCGVDRVFFNSLNGLRAYKGQSYEGGIRVPFIACWPGHIPAGTTSDLPAAMWDVMPTLADLAGRPPLAGTDGISLMPTLLGRPAKQTKHPFLYWEYAEGGNQKAVRIADWKGVRYGNAGAGAPVQLFNLANDPGETSDLATQPTNAAIKAQIETVMASQHPYNSNFFRGTDEFPIISPPTLALNGTALGVQLTSKGAPGHVLTPFEHAITNAAHFQAQLELLAAAGYHANGALLLCNGTNAADGIRAEVNGDERKFRLSFGTQTSELNFAPGEDALRVFSLDLGFNPTNGVVILREGTNRLSLTMTNGPAGISHWGHAVDGARTIFAPASVSLEGPKRRPTTTMMWSNSTVACTFAEVRRAGRTAAGGNGGVPFALSRCDASG